MDYKAIYKDWLENVKDDQKKELLSIADNDKEIKERFTVPLAFGTAGMRGIICMGISNMNEYTVARATKGLADYISSLGEEEKKRGEKGLAVYSQDSAQSGTPDCPVVHRTVSGAPG